MNDVCISRNNVCCFTGHRPKFFPWRENVSDNRAQALLDGLEQEIRRAVAEGYTTFLHGGALGVDAWAAQIVLLLKREYSQLKLIAVLPFPEYNIAVSDETYQHTIAASDKIIITGNQRGIDALTARDRYMIDHSNRLIAVYDERSQIRSGTYRALRYAEEQRLEIVRICWMDYL